MPLSLERRRIHSSVKTDWFQWSSKKRKQQTFPVFLNMKRAICLRISQALVCAVELWDGDSRCGRGSVWHWQHLYCIIHETRPLMLVWLFVAQSRYLVLPTCRETSLLKSWGLRLYENVMFSVFMFSCRSRYYIFQLRAKLSDEYLWLHPFNRLERTAFKLKRQQFVKRKIEFLKILANCKDAMNGLGEISLFLLDDKKRKWLEMFTFHNARC